MDLKIIEKKTKKYAREKKVISAKPNKNVW